MSQQQPVVGFDPSVLAVGITAYSILLVVNSTLLYLALKRKVVEWKSISVAFQLLVTLFLMFRISWVTLQRFKTTMDSDDFKIWHMVLARLSSTLYFSAFSVVLASWVQLLASFKTADFEFPKRLFWTVVISNVLVWIFLVISILLWVLGDYRQADVNSLQSHPFFSVIIYVTGVLSTIGAILFLYYGLKLYYNVRSVRREGVMGKAARRIVFLLVGITLSFLIRTGAVFYRGLDLKWLSDWVWWPTAYFVPEIMGISLQLGVYFSRFFTQSGVGVGDAEPLNAETPGVNSGDIHFVSWDNPQRTKPLTLDGALERARQIRHQPSSRSLRPSESGPSAGSMSSVAGGGGGGAALSPRAAADAAAAATIASTARDFSPERLGFGGGGGGHDSSSSSSSSSSRASMVISSLRAPTAQPVPKPAAGSALLRSGDVWKLKSSSFVAEEIGSMLAGGDDDAYGHEDDTRIDAHA